MTLVLGLVFSSVSRAIDEVLGFLKSMEQGFMEKVGKQELDIV